MCNAFKINVRPIEIASSLYWQIDFKDTKNTFFLNPKSKKYTLSFDTKTKNLKQSKKAI